MPRIALLFVLALAACGASYQTIQIKNATTRPIEELYVYPSGAAKGSSHGQLTPGASTSVKIRGGHVSVTAVSGKIQIDEHTRDRPSATQELELTAPIQVVFYDDGSAPPGLEKKGVIGVAFQLPSHAPHPDEPTQPDQPAPEAPQTP